ncbi:MAG: hypothetical protein LBQ88_11650 [Treponema sp.]|jgi:hypothetical protein|nr:hypothetical protein [Treponema sp.]
MKKNFSFVLIGIMLVIGLVLTGCAKSTYHLKWGAASISYSVVQSTITSEGWTVADSGTNWVLVTGDTANSVYEYCVDNVRWLDSGDFDGLFEECLNFSKDGVSAPQDLITAANKIRRRAPVTGIFNGGRVAVMFYITKN